MLKSCREGVLEMNMWRGSCVWRRRCVERDGVMYLEMRGVVCGEGGVLREGVVYVEMEL